MWFFTLLMVAVIAAHSIPGIITVGAVATVWTTYALFVK